MTTQKRRTWTEQQRRNAVDYAVEHGRDAAAKKYGTTRRSIERWADKLGVTLYKRPEDVARMVNARTALAARVAEARLDKLATLEATLTAATLALTDRLAVDHAATAALADLDDTNLETAIRYVDTITGPRPELTDPITRRRIDTARILNDATAPLRDLEGVITRTIHDIQLLTGEATDRGNIVVEWQGMVRPPRPEEDTDE